MHSSPGTTLSAARSLAAAETLDTMGPDGGRRLRRDDGGRPATARRANDADRPEQRAAAAFTSTHPAVPVMEIPALPEDVHDLDGLRRLTSTDRP